MYVFGDFCLYFYHVRDKIPGEAQIHKIHLHPCKFYRVTPSLLLTISQIYQNFLQPTNMNYPSPRTINGRLFRSKYISLDYEENLKAQVMRISKTSARKSRPPARKIQIYSSGPLWFVNLISTNIRIRNASIIDRENCNHSRAQMQNRYVDKWELTEV